VSARISKSRLFCIALLHFLVLGCLTAVFAQVKFQSVDREVIEDRLKNYSRRNLEREEKLKQLFAEVGCKGDRLSEQPIKGKLPPNVICVLPGQTDEVILVGAHTDKVDAGDGVVDNWSGAALLPSLFYSLNGQLRRHTFVFVGFTGEEKGMLGSDFYAHQLSVEQRSKIEAVVNMDTLGLGPTEVWATHADKLLLDALVRIAKAMKLAITAVNFDRIGTTDSESFARFKIPRITIHSLTQETLPILHSPKDRLDAIKMDDYYTTYRLLAGYLAFLDGYLGQTAVPQEEPKR
jgi:hypothetical protein